MICCCFGSLNIDTVYSVPHIVRPGETIHSSGLNVNPGGKGLNQSAAMSKAGLTVKHAGMVGTDGLFLLDVLKSFGVDVSLVKISDTVKSGNAIIQVEESGENSILLFGGANQAISIDQIRAVYDSLEPGDLVLLQNELNDTALLIEEAAKRKLRVALNAAPFTPEAKNFPYSDVEFLFVNETEGGELAGTDDIDEMIKRLPDVCPNTVILTLGEQGSVVLENGNVHRAGICKVEAVDTTAAGDTYTGYFLASYLASNDIGLAMRTAAYASAITVTRPGAAESIPYLSEIPKGLK